MDAYRQWNDALASHFFSTDMAGRNVRLYVNQDLIDQMERDMSEAGPFQAAVARDLWYAQKVCRRAFREFRRWRDRELPYPPYIGYLSFFVLAGDIDGDFAPHAYYPRLWELLGLEGRRGMIPGFNRMHYLWKDLEEWSVYDRQAELGVFQAHSVGGYVHVGYPLSQLLFVEQERRAFPAIFYDAGLDPTENYPADELARSLRRPIGRQRLRARTWNLLANRQDEELYRALMDAVAEELADWDGTVAPTTQASTTPQTAQSIAGLRICIELDRISGTVSASIRCKINREFPENGLSIEGGLEAEEAVNGWSLPLRNRATGEFLDAAQIDWNGGTTMRDRTFGWRLALRGRPVRIFINGIQEGISGLVETTVIPRGQSFYLSYSQDIWPQLQQWATTKCNGFREIEVYQGLPSNWRLASVESTTDDQVINDAIPSQWLTTRIRLRLLGGIRNGKGNNYFRFAPPVVALVGGSPEAEIYCNDRLLCPDDSGTFALPYNLAAEHRISLEARDGTSVTRLALFLTGDFRLRQLEPDFFIDPRGIGISNGSDKPSIAGAHVKGHNYDLAATTAELFEDLSYEIGGLQGFLIGNKPGQIAEWPEEPFPNDWIPTWVIKKKGRKFSAVYTGKFLSATLTADHPGMPTPKAVRNWKNIIWYRRRRFTLPRDPRERTLWIQLRELACHV